MDKRMEKFIKREQKSLDKEYEIACKLVELRNECNLSQNDIAKILNTKQHQIYRIEKGINSP